jgi:hypothetical protein
MGPGQTYFYVVTAVNSSFLESGFSDEVVAVVSGSGASNPPTSLHVESIEIDSTSQSSRSRTSQVAIKILDNQNYPVSQALVTVNLFGDLNMTVFSETDETGVATIELPREATYSSVSFYTCIAHVSHAMLIYDGGENRVFCLLYP